MKTKMMDLEIGEYYYLKNGLGTEHRGKVISKTIHNKTTHSYFIVWPHETECNPYSIHIWDHGYLGRKAIFYGYYGIQEYRKLNKYESQVMRDWFDEQERRRQSIIGEVDRKAATLNTKWQSKYESIMHS